MSEQFERNHWAIHQEPESCAVCAKVQQEISPDSQTECNGDNYGGCPKHPGVNIGTED